MSASVLRAKKLGGLWGAVVGDALGVPVEFQDRETLRRDPVTAMRAYGSHSQPRGTWSDDSALLLCTVESLLNGFDTQDMGNRFVQWYRHGYWTPWGDVFDIGNATASALNRIAHGSPAEEAGGTTEGDNGNGSLMRILPVALADPPPATLLDHAHRASKITHGHPRSQIGCGIYCVLGAALLHGAHPADAYRQTIETVRPLYTKPPFADELPRYQRFMAGSIGALAEADIQSGGYVVHSLEAAAWCLLNTGSYQEAVLKAVNLGGDTDTTATIAGGLAGVYYGYDSIPGDWLTALARRADITALFDTFVAKTENQA